MRVYEDIGNKVGKHNLKNEWWSNNGYEVVRVPLPVGDYVLENERIADVIIRKAQRGIELKKMDFLGAYNIAVDSKAGIGEIESNLMNTQNHARVRDDMILAQNNNIKLYFVVENKGGYLNSKRTIWNDDVRSIDDLFKWKNPRAFIFRHGQPLYPNCVKGAQLAKTCITMEKKYGCKFVFCTPEESAEIITRILEGRYENGNL